MVLLTVNMVVSRILAETAAELLDVSMIEYGVNVENARVLSLSTEQIRRTCWRDDKMRIIQHDHVVTSLLIIYSPTYSRISKQ